MLLSFAFIIIYIYNINLLKLPSRQTTTRNRQSPISHPSLSQTSQPPLLFYIYLSILIQGTFSITDIDHMRKCGICFVKCFTDGRWSTGQTKIKKNRFLGRSTSQYSYGGNIVQELKYMYSPSTYYLEIGASSQENLLDEYPSMESQHHMLNYSVNVSLWEVIPSHFRVHSVLS